MREWTKQRKNRRMSHFRVSLKLKANFVWLKTNKKLLKRKSIVMHRKQKTPKAEAMMARRKMATGAMTLRRKMKRCPKSLK